jgi:hypothetical protein
VSANTLRKIDEQLKELNPESIRYQVLVSVRLFRSTWIDLGRLLTEVAYGGDYKDWGYDTFEAYCGNELGLKKPTVKKLMVSYTYMQRNEPDRLQAYEDRDQAAPPPEIPDYRTVELLQKARETDDLDEEQKQNFHRIAFEDGGDETILRKEIRGAMSSVQEESDLSPEVMRKREFDDLRKSCRILRRKLADSRVVPQGLRERFECLLNELEALD